MSRTLDTGGTRNQYSPHIRGMSSPRVMHMLSRCVSPAALSTRSEARSVTSATSQS